MSLGWRRGAVTEFDDDKGYGTVTSADGVEHFFHCTQLADGTRTVAVGTAVTFEVVAGRRGRWEAAGLRPEPPAQSEPSS